MKIEMNEESIDNHSSVLQIKELKEKMRSLVSEVDLHQENAKFEPENNIDNNSNSSVCSDENEDEFFECEELEFQDDTNWLSQENVNGESVTDICKNVYIDVNDDCPDIINICSQLESSSSRAHNIFSSQKASIDSRTFTRPKKYTTRPSLTSVVNPGEDGRPKLQKRLTMTISPSPNLIPKLEELSKTNNRPVSGNYSDLNWQDGSEESLAEVNRPTPKSKRQSLPASLFDRLQELKKANSTFKVTKTTEPKVPNGRVQDYERRAIMEEAKKVTAALDVDMKNSNSSSRFLEIFRNTQDYYSDDNESFISLDEVSGFCDRLTLSTDQNTYSTIVKEMEQHEICLYHRPLGDEKSQDRRLTFGGVEIPISQHDFHNMNQVKENILNLTYEIDEEEPENNPNTTFEIKENEKHNIMNMTYDADKKPGLVDAILKSDVIKNLSPSRDVRKRNSINNNNNKIVNPSEGNNMFNRTFKKVNETLDQNELNALHTEKYSTKVFDSSFIKSKTETRSSPTRRSNGRKDSDYSEEDCMSTTSDNSYRSVDSNSEVRVVENKRSIGNRQNKEYSSTPVANQISKLNINSISPIHGEVGDGEPRSLSNPSSRGQSPRRIVAPNQHKGPNRMPNIRQPLKVPQRELKLKPALARPSQTFKRPLSSARTSSEPSVPQKVESCQPAASVPVLRPSGPAVVPSLTNLRPSSRVSGIPRPPTRLKQPQIRVNHTKK